jgi:carboxylate-amine ligase
VEAKLWTHDNNEVYEVYNKIFDCRGHGWSNLQSTHLNLPFFDGDEFAKLHAAIRLVLPILPALCASSPIIDQNFTGLLDTRLNYYRENQKRIPSIVGMVIPEQVFTEDEYTNEIYTKISGDIAPFDPEQILDPVWVNSRGSISRFDRGSIEIRLMDVQECPAADLAVATLVIETIKALVAGKFIDYATQVQWRPEPLASILAIGIESAEGCMITNREYLSVFGLQTHSATAGELWQHIYKTLAGDGNEALSLRSNALDIILTKGSLATRMLSELAGDYSQKNIHRLYQALMRCLAENQVFE